jgi:hypothetical protein
MPRRETDLKHEFRNTGYNFYINSVSRQKSDQLLQGARWIIDKVKNYHFFSMPQHAIVDQDLFIIESSLLHSDTPH